MSDADTIEMTVIDYLEWFEKNLPVVNSISATDFDFMVFLDGRRWDAGYSYMEDYEGSYFSESMRGSGDSALEALKESYSKSHPVVAKVEAITKNMIHPQAIQTDHEYLLVELSDSGILLFRKVTVIQRKPPYSSDGRIALKETNTKHEYTHLVSPSHASKILFEIPAPEIESLITSM
jgi:hypothetical protein